MRSLLIVLVAFMMTSCFQSRCKDFSGKFVYKNDDTDIAILELGLDNMGSIIDVESKIKYIIEWEYAVDNDQLFLYFDEKSKEYLYKKLVNEPENLKRPGAGVHRGFRQVCKSGKLEKIYFDLNFNEHFLSESKVIL